MCGSITEQLLKDVSNCVTFSLQLDKSTDIWDTAQLLYFIRMIFEDFIVKVLGIISLKGRTTGQEIFNSFYSFVTYLNVPFLLIGPNQWQVRLMVLLSPVDSMTTSLISFLTTALLTTHSIRGKSLQRRLFNLTLEVGTPDIILHIDGRWLSRYKFLQSFCSLLSEIQVSEGERRWENRVRR
jgi:hypothetical protein